MNSLKHLADYGQSIWLDYLRRQLVVGGELDRLIEEDGLRGMTSNPKIFEKAIGGSHDYDIDIRALALQGNSVSEVYESLSVEDVQSAADKFRPLYEESNGDHGFVSLEVNPHLARDTEGTIKEAKHLWNALNRPNVFIKVPATVEGLPAIRRLIAQGVNVNVTLLFGLPRYRKVAEAYIAGLEDRAGDGAPLDRIRSVASFFLSRIDVLVDPMLEKIMKGDDADADLAKELHGEVALSSAKVAYQIYREIFSSERFQKLAALGAQEQRLLWASTSTKNPEYSDIKYIEPLIGEKTINTTPPETLNAYRDHGDPKSRLEEDVEKARETLDRLPDLEIDIDQVTEQLVEEGIEKFNKPFDKLMDTLEKEMAAAKTERVDPQTLDLGEHHDDFERRLTALGEDDFSRRLWNKDATLWDSDEKTQKQIEGSLGWLHVAEKMESQIDVLEGFVSEVRGAGFQRVVHMGMGGSSLAPLMFSRTFEVGENGLPLTVLDTTDPKTIGKIEESLDLEKTLFIIASKSGSTAESLAFGEYFYEKVEAKKGDRAGENFVAITDPESPLVTLAQKRGFRRCFLNYRDIGGRYSALSWFGLLPAGLMGLDVSELLIRALRMSHACNSCVPSSENPGIALGAVLGELARNKRDKVTFITSPAISTFGLWLEQLIAESTGKEETGILPVAGEQVGDPSRYGDDRVFVYLRLEGEIDNEQERAVAALKEADHPVVTIRLNDRLDVGQEFFRWEIATATAGAVLGINPFDQPNVQESKDNTDELLKEYAEKSELPTEEVSVEEGMIQVFSESEGESASDVLLAFLENAHPRDYIALLAYLPEDDAVDRALDEIRIGLRDHLHLASTLGYGPRYLHSTGQLHKGGPNIGLYIQITAETEADRSIPNRPYAFGVFCQCQAEGDLRSLRKHGRRVIRIHLRDLEVGLAELKMTLTSLLQAQPALASN